MIFNLRFSFAIKIKNFPIFIGQSFIFFQYSSNIKNFSLRISYYSVILMEKFDWFFRNRSKMNTLSTRLQSWTTWVVETLYLTHGKSDPKDRSIRRNSARSRRWSVGSKNSLIIILGEIIYLVHLRIRVCLGTTWPRHDNESLVYVSWVTTAYEYTWLQGCAKDAPRG